MKNEDDIEIYKLLKQEIHIRDQMIWRTRNQSVLVAGGVLAICVNALAKIPNINAMISDSYLICEIALTAGSVINFLFWIISSIETRGIIFRGAYLYHLEKNLDITKGWEELFFKKNAEKNSSYSLLLEDIQFYISIGFILLLFVLINFKNITCYLVSISILCSITGSSFILGLSNYRKKALDDVEKSFEKSLIHKYSRLTKIDKN